MRYIILLALFLTIASCGAEQQVAQPQTAQPTPVHCQAQSGLPDPKCTPGLAFPNVTTAQVCTPGYASSVRNVPQSVKDQVFAEYGVTSHPSGAYEIDHEISLELAGSNDIRNLWPQLYTGEHNAHMKDKLEDFLHNQICSGSLQLHCAQKAISNNWIDAYNEMSKKQEINC